MVNFGAVIYVKRLHPKKKKGEKVWNPGIFLGKIENDLFITHHADGIHTSRSARAVGEPYSSEKVAAVDYFPWEVRTSTLTSRVIPQKKLPQPQASLALPAVPQGEGLQEEAIENQEHEEDELSTDEEAQGKEMVVEPEPAPVPEVTDATMLHELLPQESEQRQQEDVEVSSPRTSGAISSSSRPAFEVVGSPSKIPTLRPELPRFGPGNVGRVKMRSSLMWKKAIKKKNLKPKKKQKKTMRMKQILNCQRHFKGKNLDLLKLLMKHWNDSMRGRPRKKSTDWLPWEFCKKSLHEVQEQEYIWLTTKFVYDWRFREVGSKKRWMRRARLVASEYKVLEKRDGIFSPATTPALTRLIPCVAMMRRWCVYALDIKDAFLQVPQKRKVLCTMDEKTREKRMRSSCASWRLLYVLPGQKDAARLWSDFLAEMLEKYGVARCISSPTLFRKMIDAMVVMVLVVHVDDLQIAGEQEESNKLISDLSKETKLQKEGPFLTREERERGYSSRSMRFLKRKFVYKDEKLFVYPDKKYFSKLCEIVKVQNRKSKNTPAPTEVQHEDHSEELDMKEQSLYRSAVGLLLYVAHDRPDVQFAVRSLA